MHLQQKSQYEAETREAKTQEQDPDLVKQQTKELLEARETIANNNIWIKNLGLRVEALES